MNFIQDLPLPQQYTLARFWDLILSAEISRSTNGLQNKALTLVYSIYVASQFFARDNQ